MGYVFLKESAATEDLFDNQPHKRVAVALAEVIRSSDTGMTIGLEGEWGSGKSTAIKLLQQELDKEADLFLFDAWAHEGDALRRSFLESLLRHYVCQINNGLLKGDATELANVSKEVANQRRVTTTELKGEPTGLGIWAFVSVLGSTLGVGLLSCCRPMTTCLSWVALIFGGALVSLPFAVVIYNIWRIIKSGKDIRDPEQWSFLETSGTSTEDEKITRETERTSIEFENLFTTYVLSMLEVNKDKKFIIAIDNLDRINPKDALKIWSTLQTFLQNRNNCSGMPGDLYKQLWIIVPYDESGLKRLWKVSNGNGDAPDISVAKSFFEKCFQLRIEVPTPVMSTWVQYARDQAEKIFAGWTNEKISQVVDILCLVHDSLTDSPTPREIKTYLNQVAVACLLADSDVDLRSVCYYVLLRFLDSNTVEGVRKKLIDAGWPPVTVAAGLPEHVKDDIAGLTYGVGPKLGRELLLVDPIETTVSNENVEEFIKLQKGYGDGFWHVVDYIINQRESWFDRQNPQLSLECLRFANIMSKAKVSKVHLQALYQKLVKVLNVWWFAEKGGLALPSVSNHVEMQQVVGLLDVLSTMGDVERARKVVRVLYNVLNSQLNDVNKGQGELTDEMVADFAAILDSTSNEVKLKVVLNALDGSALFRFVTLINGHLFGSYYQWVRPPANAIATLAKTIVPNNDIPQEVFSVAHYLSERNVKQDWSIVVETILSWLRQNIRNNVRITQPNTAQLVMIMMEIAYVGGSAVEKLKELLASYEIYSYIGRNARPEIICRVAMVMEFVEPGSVVAKRIQQDALNAGSGLQLVRNALSVKDGSCDDVFINIFDEHCLSDRFWDLAVCRDNKILLTLVPKILRADDWDDYICPRKDLLSHMALYRAICGDDVETFRKTMVELLNKAKVANVALTDVLKIDGSFVKYWSELEALLDNECEYHNEAVVVVAIVEKMNCDEFVELLTTKVNGVRVLKRLVDLVPDFKLGVEMLRALEKIMLEARTEYFELLRDNVGEGSFECILGMLEPRFAFEFGERMTAKMMDVSWADEADSHYLDYAKLALTPTAIDSGKCMRRYKDCILSSKFDKLVGWLLVVHQKCVEADAWDPSDEDKILVEEPLALALQNGSEEHKEDVAEIARTYAYDPDVLREKVNQKPVEGNAAEAQG
ncbi:MAG: hypothetical protein IJI36_06960 [Kiritimatiellae bacterium]|nr:hypothetical protein [Kiritimatiellia bacterium]MBQ6338868.1 hypothetical protein [Kiritimatiellia bacterium]